MLYVLIILLMVAIILWVMIPVRSKHRAKKHQERLEAMARIKPDVESAFAEIGKYYSFSHIRRGLFQQWPCFSFC